MFSEMALLAEQGDDAQLVHVREKHELIALLRSSTWTEAIGLLIETAKVRSAGRNS
jgi:hypothetical protein